MEALVNLDKPIVVAVHGAAIGGGTTMLTHCDFIYADESTEFQMPFINLAVVPEFGSSCSVPARIGHLRAAELILLGGPFDARRAAELGLEMCRPAAYGKADIAIDPRNADKPVLVLID